MKKSVMTKWVKALRSGDYVQTKGFLKDDTGYCCLGVLCEISGIGKFVDMNNEIGYHYQISKHRSYLSILPSQVMRHAGMKSDNAHIMSIKTSLAALNDSRDYTFHQIADIIEKHYKEL